MCSADTVHITLHGHGGHGAVPQSTVDPVVACAAIVMSLQTIVARNIDPQETAIVTVGAMQAGQAANVIPATATLTLSVRALTAAVRERLEQRITELVTAQAASFGARAEIDYQHGYPVLVNHPAETELARAVALEWAGENRVIPTLRPFTASEDFAFMLEKCPAAISRSATAPPRRAILCTIPVMTSTTTVCRWAPPTGSNWSSAFGSPCGLIANAEEMT